MRDRFTRWIWEGTLPAILTFIVAMFAGGFLLVLLAAGINWLTHL